MLREEVCRRYETEWWQAVGRWWEGENVEVTDGEGMKDGHGGTGGHVEELEEIVWGEERIWR